MAEDALFYVGQKAFIKKGDEILLLIDPVLGMDFPGGKIQEGETDLLASLRREVREETQLEIEIGDPFATSSYTFRPDHRYAGKTIFFVGYECQYLGGEVVLSDEHTAYHWVNKETYKQFDKGKSISTNLVEKFFKLV